MRRSIGWGQREKRTEGLVALDAIVIVRHSRQICAGCLRGRASTLVVGRALLLRAVLVVPALSRLEALHNFLDFRRERLDLTLLSKDHITQF
jgi:hypothetical protein